MSIIIVDNFSGARELTGDIMIFVVDNFQTSNLQGSPSEVPTPRSSESERRYFNKSNRRSLVQELQMPRQSQQGA